MFISDDLTAAWKMTDNCWDQSDAGPPRGLGWGAGGERAHAHISLIKVFGNRERVSRGPLMMIVNVV